MSVVYKAEEELLGAEIEELVGTLAWETNIGDPDDEEMFNYLEGRWDFAQRYAFSSQFERINYKRDTKILLQKAIKSVRPIAPVAADAAAYDREEEKGASPIGADATVPACLPAVCEVMHTSTPVDEVERTPLFFESLITRMEEFSAEIKRIIAGEDEEDAPIVNEVRDTSTIIEKVQDASAVLEVESTSAVDEEEEACPEEVGEATSLADGKTCWNGPELVIPHELEFEELILPACKTGQGLAADESWDSPALPELKEELAWGLGILSSEKMCPTEYLVRSFPCVLIDIQDMVRIVMRPLRGVKVQCHM